MPYIAGVQHESTHTAGVVEQQLSMQMNPGLLMDKLPDGLLMMTSGADPEQQLLVHEGPERKAEVIGMEETQQLSVHEPLERKAEVTGVEAAQQLSVHEPLERKAEVIGVEAAQQLSMH